MPAADSWTDLEAYLSAKAGHSLEVRHPTGTPWPPGSSDAPVWLWNITDLGHPTTIGQPLTGPRESIGSVAFSRTGTLAAGMIAKSTKPARRRHSAPLLPAPRPKSRTNLGTTQATALQLQQASLAQAEQEALRRAGISGSLPDEPDLSSRLDEVTEVPQGFRTVHPLGGIRSQPGSGFRPVTRPGRRGVAVRDRRAVRVQAIRTRRRWFAGLRKE